MVNARCGIGRVDTSKLGLVSVSLDIFINAFSVNNCRCICGSRVDIGIVVNATPSDVQTIPGK